MSGQSCGRTAPVRMAGALAVALLTLMGVTLVGAKAATAAPPGNDARTSPLAITELPATIGGSLVEATAAPDDPSSYCGGFKSSLWYSYTPSSAQSILVGLSANGVMDGSVDIFSRARSQLSLVSCSATDKDGEALVDLDVTSGQEYLIRVAALYNSVLDKFTLRVIAPGPPTAPPGEPLPANGVVSSVDRFTNPDDVWWVPLDEGVRYRMNFVTSEEPCATVDLFPAGTTDFTSATPLRSRLCDGHTVFTPDVSGRFPIRVMAPRWARVRLPYRLAVGPAEADDSAPGVSLPTDTDTAGTITGSGLDALDLYRVNVPHRSLVRIQLDTKADLSLSLLKPGGQVLATGTSEVEVQLPRGRYYAAVRAVDGADGDYVIRRHSRVVTSAVMRVNGQVSDAVRLGHAVRLALRLKPHVNGPTTFVVEQLDPIEGWLFAARLHPRAVDGRAVVDFEAGTLGRWRVTGTFDGTRHASPAPAGTASFSVVEPLTVSAL